MLFTQREYHKGESLLVKYHRLLLELSQEELGILCKRDEGFISRIEKGQNITRDTRIILARHLRVEPADLCKLERDWKVVLIPKVAAMDKAFKKKRRDEAKARKSQRKRKKRLKDELR